MSVVVFVIQSPKATLRDHVWMAWMQIVISSLRPPPGRCFMHHIPHRRVNIMLTLSTLLTAFSSQLSSVSRSTWYLDAPVSLQSYKQETKTNSLFRLLLHLYYLPCGLATHFRQLFCRWNSDRSFQKKKKIKCVTHRNMTLRSGLSRLRRWMNVVSKMKQS